MSLFDTQIVFTLIYPINNNKIKAGNPIITLKLKGGIDSITILNKDHTELHTITKNISRKIGKICFEEFNPIKISICF